MARRTLGDKMQQGVTRVVGGKPSATFYQQEAKWKEEVREYLETPIDTVPDELADPATGGTLTLSGNLSAVNVTASGDLAVGDDATITGDLSAATVTTAEADIRHGDRVLEIPASNATGMVTPVWSNLTTGTAGAAASHVTASISPTGVVVFLSIRTSGTVNNVSGCSLTWASLVTSGNYKLWWGFGTATTGALTITLAAGASASWVAEQAIGLCEAASGARAVVQGVVAAAATATASNCERGSVGYAVGASNSAGVSAIAAPFAQVTSYDSGIHKFITAALPGGSTPTTLTPSYTAATETAVVEVRPTEKYRNSAANGGRACLEIPLAVGSRIKRVDIQGRHVGASGTFTAVLWKVNKGTGALTQLGTVTSSSGSTADQEVSITSLSETVTADNGYFLEWTATAVADQRLHGASVTYDRIAGGVAGSNASALTVVNANAPASVNLTTEGTIDWFQHGANNPFNPVASAIGTIGNKATGGRRIVSNWQWYYGGKAAGAGVGQVASSNGASTTTVSWTAADEAAATTTTSSTGYGALGSTTGIINYGFNLRVPARATQQVLRIYYRHDAQGAGVGTITITATLSDGTTQSVVAAYDAANLMRVATVTFAGAYWGMELDVVVNVTATNATSTIGFVAATLGAV